MAWMVGTEIYATFWFENLKDRDYLEYIVMNASITFRWAIKSTAGGHKLDFYSSRQGQVADSCEHSNGFHKMWEIP